MRKTWAVTALILLVVAGGSYGLYLYLRPADLPVQLLYANGHIEGTEVRIASEVQGQVLSSTMTEGEEVSEGDLLLEIDNTQLVLERQRLEAETEALERERQRAQVQLDTARHHLKTASDDLERYRELQSKGTVSPQQLERAENAFEEARGAVDALIVQISAREAKIEALNRQQEIIEYRISKTRLTAPVNGTVLTKALDPGEYAQPGQVAAVLVDLSEVELRVFIPEADLGKVTLGDPARIRVDAFPDRLFDGHVARVEQRAQFTPRDIHMPDERVRTVFGVILSVENLGRELKPGMPADAWILWDDKAGWPDRLFVPG